MINLVSRDRVPSGQRQETEPWDNPFRAYECQSWRPKAHLQIIFHGTIQFSLRKLGKAERFFLKEQQYEILKAVAIEKKDVLAVLSTGYGTSFVYQSLGFICDF